MLKQNFNLINYSNLNEDQLKYLITLLGQQNTKNIITIETLQQQITNLKQENRKTKVRTSGSLKKLFRKVAALEYKNQKYENVVSQNENLSDLVNQLHNENDILKERDPNIESQVYNRFKEEVEANLKRESDLRKENKKLKEQLKSQEISFSLYKKKTQFLIQEFKENNLEHRQEQIALIESYDKKIKELKEQNTELINNNNKFKKLNEELNNQANKMKIELKKNEDIIKRKVLLLIEERNKLKNNLELIQKEKENKPEFTNLVSKIQQLTDDFLKIMQENTNIKIKLNQQKEQYEKKLKEMDDELNLMKLKTMKSLKEQNEETLLNKNYNSENKLKQNLIKFQKMNKDLSNEISNSNKEMTANIGRVRQNEKKITNLEEEIVELNEQITQYKKENLNLSNKSIEQHSELLILRNVNQENIKLDKKIKLYKQIQNTLKEETYKFQVTSKMNVNQIEELESENDNLRRTIDKLHSNISELIKRTVLTEYDIEMLHKFSKKLKTGITNDRNNKNNSTKITQKVKNTKKKNENKNEEKVLLKKSSYITPKRTRLHKQKFKTWKIAKDHHKKSHNVGNEEEDDFNFNSVDVDGNYEDDDFEHVDMFSISSKITINKANISKNYFTEMKKENQSLVKKKRIYEKKIRKLKSELKIFKMGLDLKNKEQYQIITNHQNETRELKTTISLLKNIKPVLNETIPSNKTLELLKVLLRQEEKVIDQRIMKLNDPEALVLEKTATGILVNAGTLDKLLKVLIHPEYLEIDYRIYFVLSFRRFCKPIQILKYLRREFLKSQNKKNKNQDKEIELIMKKSGEIKDGESGVDSNDTNDNENKEKNENTNSSSSNNGATTANNNNFQKGSENNDNNLMQKSHLEIVQTHIVRFCLIWVQIFFSDFRQDNKLTKLMLNLISCTSTSQFENIREISRSINFKFNLKLRNKIDPEDEYKVSIIDKETPEPILPMKKTINWKAITFIDLNEIGLARQMTLFEMGLFQRIEAKEFIKKRWSKKDKKLTPNLIEMIQRFNNTSLWIVSTILSYEKVKMRSQIITKFIKCGKESIRLGNFNTAMEIVAGLNNSAIRRLRKSWALVLEEEIKDFEDFSVLLSSRKNSQNLRNAISEIDKNQKPLLPYLGMFLSDLTFIEDGNPDRKTENTNLINFKKINLIGSTLVKILNFQKRSFNFKFIPEFQQFLSNLTFEKDEIIRYELSVKLEPNPKQ
ncbi:guanine nucleotide exchange factor [Anaeramoeba flamelloides]|uniref:Guanine nucleotide exchange factor n=1 Tax=Anaeramoeba flamelloides TaxID=1746091 RepID=A0AAV7ZZ43_9EUKA|nr:guanine nucleotide exchange factor [Anaeramoeba flamelloides]